MNNNLNTKPAKIWMIIGLFLAVFVTGADSFIISPLLTTLGLYFHATIPQVSLGVTIYALCYAIGSPFWGPLGDRFPQKDLLISGISIFLIGTVLCGVATRLYTFYLFRAIAGIGASLLVPNIWAFVGSHFTGRQLAIVMGIIMSALSLSIAIGVPIGTFLSQLMNWHMAFWGSGLLTVIAFIVILITIPTEQNRTTKKVSYLANFVIVKKTKNALPSLLTTLLWMFGFYILYTFLGTFLTQQFRLNTAQTGYVFIVYGLSNFLASFIGGVVNNKLGITTSIKVNGIASVITIFIIGLLGKNLYLLILLLMLSALFQGFGVSALNTFIVNVVPTNRSTVMSFNSSFLYLGLTLGSLIGGLAYDKYGFISVCVLSAIGLIVAILNTLRFSLEESIREND